MLRLLSYDPAGLRQLSAVGSSFLACPVRRPLRAAFTALWPGRAPSVVVSWLFWQSDDTSYSDVVHIALLWHHVVASRAVRRDELEPSVGLPCVCPTVDTWLQGTAQRRCEAVLTHIQAPCGRPVPPLHSGVRVSLSVREHLKPFLLSVPRRRRACRGPFPVSLCPCGYYSLRHVPSVALWSGL